jgi:hypothetical protein
MEKIVKLEAVRYTEITDIFECDLILSEFPSLQDCSFDEMISIIKRDALTMEEQNKLWDMIYDNEVLGDMHNVDWEFDITPSEDADDD